MLLLVSLVAGRTLATVLERSLRTETLKVLPNQPHMTQSSAYASLSLSLSPSLSLSLSLCLHMYEDCTGQFFRGSQNQTVALSSTVRRRTNDRGSQASVSSAGFISLVSRRNPSCRSFCAKAPFMPVRFARWVASATRVNKRNSQRASTETASRPSHRSPGAAAVGGARALGSAPRHRPPGRCSSWRRSSPAARWLDPARWRRARLGACLPAWSCLVLPGLA